MLSRPFRARRRPARRFTILMVTAILGGVTILGVALRHWDRNFPWTERNGAEIHIGV